MSNQSPFRFVEKIKNGTPLNEEEMKEFQPFLLNKLYYYSGKEKIANIPNILWSLPKEALYKLFCGLYKGINPTGWIKKEKKDKKDNLVVEYLKKKYKVSTKIAEEYFELLDEKTKKEIKKAYQ